VALQIIILTITVLLRKTIGFYKVIGIKCKKEREEYGKKKI
jgi:hypothetical protein